MSNFFAKLSDGLSVNRKIAHIQGIPLNHPHSPQPIADFKLPRWCKICLMNIVSVVK